MRKKIFQTHIYHLSFDTTDITDIYLCYYQPSVGFSLEISTDRFIKRGRDLEVSLQPYEIDGLAPMYRCYMQLSIKLRDGTIKHSLLKDVVVDDLVNNPKFQNGLLPTEEYYAKF